MFGIDIYWFLPFFILLGLIALLGALALLGRFRGGKYLRPLIAGLAKIPLLRRLLQRASRKAIERSNPELASAMRKLERTGSLNDPRRAQQALSRLTPAERKAYLETADDMGALPEGVNRAQRRRMEKMRKGQRR